VLDLASSSPAVSYWSPFFFLVRFLLSFLLFLLVDESAETSDSGGSAAGGGVELKNGLHVVDGELVLLETLVGETATHHGLHVLGVLLDGEVGILEHLVPVLVLRMAGSAVAVQNRALVLVLSHGEGAGVALGGLLVAAVAEVVVALGLGELPAAQSLAVGANEAALLLEGLLHLVELGAEISVAGVGADTLLQDSLCVLCTREGEEGDGAAEVALAPLRVELGAGLCVLQSLAVHVLAHVGSRTVREVHVVAIVDLDGLAVEVDGLVEPLLTEGTVALLLESLCTLTSTHYLSLFHNTTSLLFSLKQPTQKKEITKKNR